jgi:hypothetical protein
LRKEIYMSKAFVCISLTIALAIPLAACSGEGPPAKTGIAPPLRIPDVAAPAGPVGVVVPSASLPREVRRIVVADAARRFKVAASAVVLARAEKITWSDASLGCPEPGRMYAQTLVEGFRVTAKTDGGSLIYNTDSGGKVVSCGASPPPGSATMDTEPRPYPTPSAPEK